MNPGPDRLGQEVLRVLLVTNRYPSAGAPASGTFVPPLQRALGQAGLRVELLRIDRQAAGRWAYRGAFSLVRRTVRSFDPHVVHVLWGGLLAWVTVIAIRDRPVVVTFGGTDLNGLYLSVREGPVRHLSRLLAVAASRFAARRARHIVLVSQSLLPALPRNVAPDKCSVIPMGVNTALFRPLDRSACQRELGWAPHHRHILFPSSPRRPEKRFSLARQTLAVLKRRGHDAELHALEAVPHQDVPTWMNAADALLLTSSHEGSPRAVKEALACGRPIVSVDVGDVRDLLGSLECCRIAGPDPVSLADGMVQVWNASGPCRQACERAQGYSWTRTAVETERVYRLCTSRRAVKGTGTLTPGGPS